MVHFVMVHGASHGGWCWYKVRSQLETYGHKATCIDLKSAGIDMADPNKIASLDEYNEPLVDLLSNLPENEKVALVGHSLGGFNVTDALCKFPKKIHFAVYVAAAMVKMWSDEAVPDPSNIYSDRKGKEISFGKFDFWFENGPPIPTSLMVKKERWRELLYNMSPLEDFALASMLLQPAPFRLFPQFLGGPDADSVPRFYIRTLQDCMMEQTQQDKMINDWPPYQVFGLESDHSPFFSTPSLLVDYLVKAADSLNL